MGIINSWEILLRYLDLVTINLSERRLKISCDIIAFEHYPV